MDSNSFKRKLTAILSADVVGYSRLTRDDEEATVRTLNDHKKMIFNLIERNQGRLVDSIGDNFLAEFVSVVDAVRCAVQIQEDLKGKNEGLPENRKMKFRIGINLGDVIQEGDRIYGDGVNVAARIESLADAGGVRISRSAYDQVEGKLNLRYEYQGEHQVKNIDKPVRVYKVLMESGSEELRHDEKILKLASDEPKASSMSNKPSIAVLPFVNISSDPEQEYFVDGLSEELLNSLCQITDLNVTARTSSFSFKGTNKTVQEIASVLGVENILEGSVRKAGDALRITAQLVRALDGFHLWSKTYNRELKDIFAVQENIATAVADELKITLGIGKTLKQLGGTNNEKAYELYLISKGNPVTPENLDGGLGSIDAAIALDPEFALAWAQKANIHQMSIMFLPANKVPLDQDAGLHAAQKAIELEPNLPDGYFALGKLRSDMGDWIEAELAFRKARERITEPSLRYKVEYPILYWFVGYLERGKEVFKAFFRNDPINIFSRTLYIISFSFIGDMQQAEEEYKLARSLFRDDLILNGIITVARLGSGNLVSRDDIVYSDSICDAAKEHLDSPKEGLAELHKLYADDNLRAMDLGFISIWAAYFGDPVFAMDALAKSLSLGVNVLWNVWLPVYHEVRQLTRFKEFVKEIGLFDYWNKFGWPDMCRQLENGDLEFD